MTNKARNKKGELDTFGAVGLAEGFIEGTKDEQIEAWPSLRRSGGPSAFGSSGTDSGPRVH